MNPTATSASTVSELEQLTDRILIQHERVQMTAQQMVEAMIECGETMMEARQLVPQGEWGRYVKSQLGIHPKTAATYIRFARYADILRREKPATIHAARRVLADLGVPRLNNALRQKDEAKKLRKSGMTYDEIAEHFEVPRSTVSYWLNADTMNANKKKHSAALQTAKKQLDRKRAARAMKDAKGTDIEFAYSQVRKALDRLQVMQGLGEESREVHDCVSQAMAALYRAEDKLVDASRAKFSQ